MIDKTDNADKMDVISHDAASYIVKLWVTGEPPRANILAYIERFRKLEADVRDMLLIVQQNREIHIADQALIHEIMATIGDIMPDEIIPTIRKMQEAAKLFDVAPEERPYVPAYLALTPEDEAQIAAIVEKRQKARLGNMTDYERFMARTIRPAEVVNIDTPVTSAPARRPNIGEPGFEWQVGMVVTGGNGDATVYAVGKENHELRDAIATVDAHGFRISYFEDGRYVDSPSACDLVRVIKWPDGWTDAE